jgi:hypothetical protein
LWTSHALHSKSVQSCEGIVEQRLLRHPFVNSFEFSSKNSDSPSLVEVLHLSKYLQGLKPMVLVTMSTQVLKLFHDNALVYCLEYKRCLFPKNLAGLSDNFGARTWVCQHTSALKQHSFYRNG